jgi:type VI secretion system secreted protein VgrG
VTSTPTVTPTVTPTSAPTYTPTPTPTITSTPTVTPTGTPTVTPTATPTPFSGTIYYGSTISNVCPYGAGSSGFVTGDGTTFCGSQYFTGNTFAYQSTGFYYMNFEGNVVQISLTYGSNVVEVMSACMSCPTPTPTPTITATPTVTPTGTPTVTPTGTPTVTPTPTIDPNFYYIAERNECQGDGTCLYTEELFISNPTELTIAPNPRFRLDPTSGYILKVTSSTTPRTALITSMTGLGTLNCSSFCAQPPTPTPTSTPTPTPTPTNTPIPPTDTPTPTPTATPTPLPDGVSSFGSTVGGEQPCGVNYGPNDYEYYITYNVNFTSARNTMGYVVVYLSDYSSIQIPFNENDTSASTTVFCPCGSPCADMSYVMNIIYTTPTPTPTLEPTFTPTPTTEGGGGEELP